MRRVVVGVLVVLGVAGCGGGPERLVQPTPRPVSAACTEAWDEFVASLPEVIVSPDDQPTAPASPVPVPLGRSGQFADLYPTLEACESSEEWLEAFAAHPNPVTDGSAGITVLRELCQFARRQGDEPAPCANIVEDEPLDEVSDFSPAPS